MTKVIVAGALGRMGRETIAALAKDSDLDLAGGVAPNASEEYLDLPGGGGLIPISRDLETMIKRVRPRVMVDFAHPHVVMENVRIALKHKVSPVVGTSGITPAHLAEIEGLTAEDGVACVVAPNFAIGVNLMMRFARIAAIHVRRRIIELHHDKKVDAPSGTAVATAREMVAARGGSFDESVTTTLLMDGARGASEGGIHVHSVRLPGLVAHQEIFLAALGRS